jgi:hypothetical protein
VRVNLHRIDRAERLRLADRTRTGRLIRNRRKMVKFDRLLIFFSGRSLSLSLSLYLPNGDDDDGDDDDDLDKRNERGNKTNALP